MARAVIQANIQTANGVVSVAPGATVEIRRESDGGLVVLYDARTGGSPVINPITADPGGFFRAYCDPQLVYIRATSGVNVAEWRDIDLMSSDFIVAKDSDTGAAYIPAGTTAQRPSVGNFRVNTETGTIEASFDGGTTWTPTSETAATILSKLLTVDGSGSGLDADLVRGTTPSAFGLSLLDDANATTALSTLGIQAFDAAATWQDVTASRALAATYTNTTGHPIVVSIRGNGSGPAADLQLTIAGSIRTAANVYGTASVTNEVTAVVPDGATYGATISAGSLLNMAWHEMR